MFDLKGAFCVQCRITPEQWRFFGVVIDRIPIQLVHVFFGLGHGPRIFASALNASLSLWKQRSAPPSHVPDTQVSRCVDDVCAGRTDTDYTRIVSDGISMLDFLHQRGHWPSVSKSYLLPAETQLWIGIRECHRTKSLMVSAQLVDKIRRALLDIQDALHDLEQSSHPAAPKSRLGIISAHIAGLMESGQLPTRSHPYLSRRPPWHAFAEGAI